MGSFCPLTRVFIPSMVEIPVSMKSAGESLAQGLMAAPAMSSSCSGTILDPPSRGSPAPLRTLPSISLETGIFMVSPRKRTEAALSIPVVPSNIWTTTMSSDESRTSPLFTDPSESLTETSSLYPTGSVFFTNTRGPAIWEMVLYSLVTVTIFKPPVC